MKATTCTL